MAPNRPLLWPEQWPLALLTAAAVVAGVVVVIVLLTHG
jgi:hypothetical protein